MTTTPTCPVCATATSGVVWTCPSCAVVLHQSCFEYQGGCGIYGCGTTSDDIPLDYSKHFELCSCGCGRYVVTVHALDTDKALIAAVDDFKAGMAARGMQGTHVEARGLFDIRERFTRITVTFTIWLGAILFCAFK